jgi:hypothetical protein
MANWCRLGFIDPAGFILPHLQFGALMHAETFFFLMVQLSLPVIIQSNSFWCFFINCIPKRGVLMQISGLSKCIA